VAISRSTVIPSYPLEAVDKRPSAALHSPVYVYEHERYKEQWYWLQ